MGDYEDLPLDATQNIFYGICVANDDPLMLGRVRIYPDQQMIDEVIRSVDGFNEDSSTPEVDGPWSILDPFVYLPLLPYFINQIPQEGEYATLFYFNNKKQMGRNKYYMISTFSSPTTILKENYRSSKTHLSSGIRNSLKPFPNLKDRDGKHIFPNNKGVFSEPIDISINGRDSADLIIQRDSVLLRAGKHKDFNSGQIPERNDERGFLQLSRFKTIKKYGNPTKKIKLTDNSEPIRFLIEYDIFNPENVADAFTGSINIFKVEPINASEALTTQIKYNSDLSGITKSKIRVINFQSAPLSGITDLINNTLITFKDRPEDVLLNPLEPGKQFPFFYRPEKSLRIAINNLSGSTQPDDINSMENMSILKQSVKISRNLSTEGYGLVLDKKVSPLVPFKVGEEVVTDVKTKKLDNTVGLMGASQLFLLSHNSVIPGKGKIDLTNTVYGIDSNVVFDEIEPKTSSMVRGEELMKLVGLIVNFLTSHVHPYPGLPPVSVAQDGTRVDDILSELQQAYDKILNQNIRIN